MGTGSLVSQRADFIKASSIKITSRDKESTNPQTEKCIKDSSRMEREVVEAG